MNLKKEPVHEFSYFSIIFIILDSHYFLDYYEHNSLQAYTFLANIWPLYCSGCNVTVFLQINGIPH